MRQFQRLGVRTGDRVPFRKGLVGETAAGVAAMRSKYERPGDAYNVLSTLFAPW